MDKNTSYCRGFAEGAAQRTDDPKAVRTEINTFLIYKEENNKVRQRCIRREAKLRAFADWAFLAGLCWGLTPYFFHIAATARPNRGVGGEIIIPLIPFLCLMLHAAGRKKQRKK